MKKRIMIALLTLAVGSMVVLPGCAVKKLAQKHPYEVSVNKTFTCGTRDGEVLVVNMDVKNTSDEYVDASTISYSITGKIDGKTLEQGYLSEENPNALSVTEKIEPGEDGKAQLVLKLDKEVEGTVDLIGVGYATSGGKQVEFLKESIDLSKVEKVVSESDYELTIDNVVKTDDGEGKNLLIVDMTFTNNGEEAEAFSHVINLEVFQNAIALKNGYLPYKHPANDDSLNQNNSLKIQKGASLKVREVFELNDDSAVVEVKATDYNSFDGATLVEKEIQLN